MIRELFERKASYQAEVLAEAQALIDDGLEAEFVLGIFPDEAEWLAPMLTVTESVEAAFDSEPASYYFEASLKAKFLGQVRDPRPVVPVVIPVPTFSPVRTAIATMSVAGAAAAVGILSLGFITAGDSVPGDWNYTFKLANERFEYTMSRGDHRIDVQLRQANNRAVELNKLAEKGTVSQSQIERVQREWDELNRIAKGQDLDAMRRAQIESSGKSAVAVVNDVANKQPELAPAAAAVAAAVDDTVTGLPALPTPTPSATPTTAPTASPSASPTAEATPTPKQTETPAPEATATADATETSTTQPSEAETGTPSPSPAP